MIFFVEIGQGFGLVDWNNGEGPRDWPVDLGNVGDGLELLLPLRGLLRSGHGLLLPWQGLRPG